MTIDDIEAFSEDQDRGHWFDLLDPVSEEKTGIRLLIVGPDSDTQRRNRLRLADELDDYRDGDGRISAESREKCRLTNLARCVRDWEVEEDLAFSFESILRLLRAGQWVQSQVDLYADMRGPYRGKR